jgi:hypothetical protein
MVSSPHDGVVSTVTIRGLGVETGGKKGLDHVYFGLIMVTAPKNIILQTRRIPFYRPDEYQSSRFVLLKPTHADVLVRTEGGPLFSDGHLVVKPWSPWPEFATRR